MDLELTPWDYWEQDRDPALDGDGGSGGNALNDCGPECLSMVCAHLTGTVLDADYILDQMFFPHGQTYRGYTSIQNLHDWLSRWMRTPSLMVFATTQEQWTWNIWQSLAWGHPVIGLFSFSAPGAQDGHFRCITGASGTASMDTVITADPWNGQRRVQPLAELWPWAKGQLIRVHRKRSIIA